jgi:uncharacterized protein (TIGR02996 family)
MTPQEEAFLHALRERPADDLPRLAYADWLEEQDDPRGRYLRVELELSRLTESASRHAALEAELQELRAATEPEWLDRAGKRYDLVLHSFDPAYKIHVVTIIRELRGCGLKEAKDLSEQRPPIIVKAATGRADAEHGREQLRYYQGKQVAEVEVRVSNALPAAGPVAAALVAGLAPGE